MLNCSIDMQQFVIPQFIEVEDKILGPITIRQFLIMLVGGLLIFLAFRFGDFALFVTTLIVVGSLTLVVAFVKINGQTFHYFLLNIFATLRKPGLRIWRKSYHDKELDYLRKLHAFEVKVVSEQRKAPRREHIRDLSLIVNTGGYYRGDEEI